MNEINLIRGDTESIKVQFVKGESEHRPNDLKNGDVLTFTMRDVVRENAVLVKKITIPEMIFNLTHDDTKRLIDKRYDFDIEYRTEDKSVVKTLVIGKAIVRKDVTYDENC